MRVTTTCSLFGLVLLLTGCAAEPPTYARGRAIRNAETDAATCRAEVSRAAYNNQPVTMIGAPQVLTRPSMRAITIAVAPATGTAPQAWHCLFDPRGAFLSVAPGEAQASGDLVY